MMRLKQFYLPAVFFGICAAVCVGQPAAQMPAGRESVASAGMTVQDVIRLAKAGVSEDLIIAQMRAKHASFDLTADQLLALKRASVSDRVIRAMLELPAPTALPHQRATVARASDPAAAPVATAPGPAKVGPVVAKTNPAVLPAKTTATLPVRTAAQSGPAAWVSHNDPSGFTLKIPPGWNVPAERHAGKIQIQGPDGQRVVIWPMFIDDQQLDGRGAGVLVGQLARRVDSDMSWEAPKLAGDTARVFAHGRTSGAALL